MSYKLNTLMNNKMGRVMMHTKRYETTHPWLSFQVDLRAAGRALWIALGEVASKCEHLAGVPLIPAVSSRLHALYLAKGLQATTAIEGNSLSEEDVRAHLDGALKLPPSQEYLGLEIDNIKVAVQAIDSRILDETTNSDVTVALIKQYNRMVLDRLQVDEKTTPGEFRRHEVSVGTAYHGAPAEDCEYLLGRMCDWLNQREFCPADDSAIVMGVIRAILAHLYIAWIHPFGDGNGRTARLVEFQILTTAGVPSAAAHLLSNHYNQTRHEYYRQLALASSSSEGVLSFITYAVRGFVDGLREQIRVVQKQQLKFTWGDYLRWAFDERAGGGPIGKVDQRRLRLAQDISAAEAPIPLAEVRQVSTRIAAEYATKSRLTLARDLAQLQAMDLIRIERGKCSARLDRLEAFLPLRKRKQG